MPPRDGHSASRIGGHIPYDRRITDLVDHHHSHNLISRATKQPAADPHRGMPLEWLNHANANGLHCGMIVYPLAHAHWYKVQLDGVKAPLGCCSLSESGHAPFGVRHSGTLPAGCHVVVWVPAGRTHGVIIGSYPIANQDPSLLVPDWHVQGGQAGIKREDAYKLPTKNLFHRGDLLDFSAGRPIDSISGEYALSTETGIEFLIDSWQTYLRVNEACGLFLNYFDSYTRLAGIQLDVQSAAHDYTARLDEGENRLVQAEYTYPWEALGLYDTGQQLHYEFDPTQVQYSIAKGAYDLADGEEDVQTIARWMEHGGYLGQGRLRTLMVPSPGNTAKKRFYKDDPTESPDLGLFREMVALDGTYMVESAKQIIIAKRVLIPVAKEMKLPEDQNGGDDARKNNYKFSGQFGNGDPHKVQDLNFKGATPHLLAASALDDVVTYAANWQAVHPFHYHKGDYKVPQESDLPNANGPQAVQDKLSFDDLNGQLYMQPPQPKTVKIDKRYNDVNYYQREAGINFLPDGGVVIYDGYGSAIVMTAGNIRFECPGSVYNLPGRSAVTMAGYDIIQRAYNSVDITANQNDVRIKAEHNLQMLGGNATQGGILLESQAPGFVMEFDNKVGEDVVMGGIVLKSPNAGVVAWGGTIYMRTGGGDSQTGLIVLDADSGQNQVVFNGSTVDTFAGESINLWIGSAGGGSGSFEATATYNFTASAAVLSGELIVGGAAVYLGPIVVQGAVAATGGFAAGEGAPFVGNLKPGDVASAFAEASQAISEEESGSTTFYDSVFANYLYKPNEPGDDTVIKQAHFSYRDKDQQYGTNQFKFPESRWQMMQRLKMASGGSGWDENPVTYQGQQQMPWPGNDNWTSQTLLQVDKMTFFDPDKGYAQDRGATYETTDIADFTTGTPETDYVIIR